MDRRTFIRRTGLALLATWTGLRFHRPPEAAASAAPELRLAFLADAHLKDGDERRPEAKALARAVAELRLFKPAPQLVLFAGDLAHRGDPAALALGREILADLPAPCLMVMGEGDGLPDAAAPWRSLFGDPRFSYVLPKTGHRKPETLQLLGLHTAWCPGPGGPLFRVGDSGRRWLARELARLDPEAPLILLSHAPLDPVFRPWQQWTLDGSEVLASLSRFRRVLCLHGHTHNAGARNQWSVVSKDNDFREFFTENRKPKTENRPSCISLPATAWPQPQALQGTPPRLSPGLGPSGCGWLLLVAGPASFQGQPKIWQA